MLAIRGLNRSTVWIITNFMSIKAKKKVLQKLLWLAPAIWGGFLYVYLVLVPQQQFEKWARRLGGEWHVQQIVLVEVVESGWVGEGVDEMLSLYLKEAAAGHFLKAMLFLEANGWADTEVFKKQFELRLWPMAYSDILKSDTGGRVELWVKYAGMRKKIFSEMRDLESHDLAFLSFVKYLEERGVWSDTEVGDVIWRRWIGLQLKGGQNEQMRVARWLGDISTVALIGQYGDVFERVLTDEIAEVRLAGLISVLDLSAAFGFQGELMKCVDLCIGDDVFEIRQVAMFAKQMILLNPVLTRAGEIAEIEMSELEALCGDERGDVRNVACAMIVKRLGFDRRAIEALSKKLIVSLDDDERASGLMIAGLSGVRPRGEKTAGSGEVDLLDYLLTYVPWEMKQRVRLAKWMQGGDDAFTEQIPILVKQGKIDLATLVLGVTHVRRYELIEGLWRGDKMVDPRLLKLLDMRYRDTIFELSKGVGMPRFVAGLEGKEKQRSQIEIAVWLRLGLYRLRA